MKLIFIDEAGVSAVEPVTVVVGLIADADKHVFGAEQMVKECLRAVPSHIRKNFVFHSAEIFNDASKHKEWVPEDRLQLLESMMSIPKKIGMSITLSVFWRNSVDLSDQSKDIGISSSQFEHLIAFSECLTVSDAGIRRHGRPLELAMAIAEDVEQMRRYLRVIPRGDEGLYLSKEHLRKTSKDKEAKYITQSGDIRIERIRNPVHFVKKSEDLIVQIADACAFGFRRYFSENDALGERFVRAILGDVNKVKHFAPPSGAECWWNNENNF